MFDTFYEDHLEFKHYKNDISKTITPRFEIVTNLSNDNVSLQKKKKKKNRFNKKLKFSKMKIATLKVTSRPNSKLLKIYPDLKIDL